MCHPILPCISLGLTVILLIAGGSDGVSGGANNLSVALCNNQTILWTLSMENRYAVTGLAVAGVLILLSLACNCIICMVIICKKTKRTVPVSHQEDKEGTRVETGEDELFYTTVKFTQDANESGQVTKFDPKSEYATVVMTTPDLGTPQLDCEDNVEE